MPGLPPRNAQGLLGRLGPGLITGASDDDPSGIATYSQTGAQFGYAMCWVMLFCFPLMAAIQEISARIGRTTGQGIAGNIRAHYSRGLLYAIVGLLLIANTIDLGADLGAMAAAPKLLVGGRGGLYVAGFAIGCTWLEVFSQYQRYLSILKWGSFVLLTYVAVALVVGVPWGHVLHSNSCRVFRCRRTTSSLWSRCWGRRSRRIVSSGNSRRRRKTSASIPPRTHSSTRRSRRRKRSRACVSTPTSEWVISNVNSLFIIVATAATLNANGVTDIQTSAQAAEGLRPIAGVFTFALFAAGVTGIGLLAVPVLAASGA